MLNEYYMLVDTTFVEYKVVETFSGTGAEAAALEGANERLKVNPTHVYVVVKATHRFSLPRSPVLVERFK